MYAIVDIETTGGYAANNDITEVAIVLHDGIGVTGRYQTLVKPVIQIPRHIQALTGITPQLVAAAPSFAEVAGNIASLLKDKIFVAHNVNFDHSFLKHHLTQEGLELGSQRLCTVRLAKKVFPGLASYSLGNLCRHFGITIHQRHRAGGDVDATVRLFEHLLQHNAGHEIEQFLKRGSREQMLPPNLDKAALNKLPYSPGVYYFHDQKGKVIYVGKARNLKYRVCSHFSNTGAGRQRQNFLMNIYDISFQTCATELMAFILENVEIRRLWPAFNHSQKRFNAAFGLYLFEDRKGFWRLAIDKKRRSLQPIYTFHVLVEGHRILHQLIHEFKLCPKLCFIQTDDDPCTGVEEGTCLGACEGRETPKKYNKRVQKAINFLGETLPTFAVMDDGNHKEEQSCILVEKGKFYGMGYIPAETKMDTLETIKSFLQQYPENDYVRGLIYSFLERKPEKKFIIPVC